MRKSKTAGPDRPDDEHAPFLRNAWYCAAWSHEIGREPVGRRLLGDGVVLFRRESGGIIALEDLCPHRFAPLHVGIVRNDSIACRYHGLQFGEGGRCVHDPHGGGAMRSLRVRSYPLVERDNIVWLWMGSPSGADPGRIPVFPAHSSVEFRTIYDSLPVEGSYQLVCDNLLDLSHTQYLHSVLQRAEDSHYQLEVEDDGHTVTSSTRTSNTSRSGFLAMIWPDGPERIDSRGSMKWLPPAALLQTIDPSPAGHGPGNVHIRAAHIATPVTGTSCHYFWSLSRNVRLDDRPLDEQLWSTVDRVFRQEDAWMIAMIQQNLGTSTDLLRLSPRPAMLPVDRAAVRARIIMNRLLSQEAGGTPQAR